MLKRSLSALTLACQSGLILTLGCSLAGADATIVSSVRTVRPVDPAQNQVGETRPDETQTYTAYYKNDRVRVEKGDGTVTLYDFKSNQVYLLTPADKTYALLSLNDFLKREPFPGMQESTARAAGLKTDVKLTLNKDEVVEPKTYVGRQAQVFDLAGSLTVGPNTSSEGRSSGFPGGFGRRGGRRGGGFPGGGGGNSGWDGGGRRASQPARTAQIEGEVWLASPDILSAKTKISWLPMLRTSVPSGALAKPLMDKISGAKGFPVASKVTFNGPNSQTGSGGSGPITIYSEIKTISEGSLDDGLFKIPADYQRIDAR
jgi:hypothetical protein